MTKQWGKRIQTRACVTSLMAVCMITASVPSSVAKKGSFRVQEGNASIPAGTIIHIRMIDELDTGRNRSGDAFRASLARPIVVDGRSVAAKDALVRGKVTEVVDSGRLKRPASLTLELTQVALANGRTVALETSPYKLDGKSHALRNATLIGGSAAAGAVLGGVAAGQKGAVIGSAVGAGAGTATAYLTGKQEIVVPVETNLQLTTSKNSLVGERPQGDSRERANSAVAHDNDGHDDSDWVFSKRDRRTIRDYFRNRHNNLPPGLAKRGGNLPPGLEKQLQRNGKLPPGLQKRVEPFPRDLEIQLPRISERIRRVILGRHVMLLDDADTILDELMLD